MSTNTVSSHAEASPARADLSRRAILRGAPSVAALAVAAAVPAMAFAGDGADLELRDLWAQYLKLVRLVREYSGPHNAAYEAFMSERTNLEDEPPEVLYWEWLEKSEPLREKHNLDALWEPLSPAITEANGVIEAIRGCLPRRSSASA